MKMHEAKELTIDELKLKLEDSREELSNLRFQKALGQLNNPLRIRTVRREIAQLKTVLHEYGLGVRKRASEVQEEE